MRNPLRWYIEKVKSCIEPTNPTHNINMNVEIPVGEKEGRALIPCSIYTMTHIIDVNPSLVRNNE